MTDTFTADLTLHPAFELIEHRHIEALSIDVIISQHVKTGAMHYHLAHPSSENAFWRAFVRSQWTPRVKRMCSSMSRCAAPRNSQCATRSFR